MNLWIKWHVKTIYLLGLFSITLVFYLSRYLSGILEEMGLAAQLHYFTHI
jgi:hypothetical protein